MPSASRLASRHDLVNLAAIARAGTYCMHDEVSLPKRTRSFRIGNFNIDPLRNAIAGADGEQIVEPKMMDVLCVLAERAGAVVSREELIDAVWGRSFGADESLTRIISRLRRIFGDARDRPTVIETIAKRGYRLIPVPRYDGTEEPAVEATVSGNPGRRRRLLAVLATLMCLFGLCALIWWRETRVVVSQVSTGPTDGVLVTVGPFAASTDSGTDRVFARDLERQLAAALARSSLLHVVTAGSVDGNASDTDAAGSGFLVEGAVDHVGDTVRISVSVVDAASGRHVWSQDFTRSRGSRVDGRDDLVGAMAAELDDRLLVAAKAALRKQPLASLTPWELNLLATWVPGSDEVFLHPHGRQGFLPQERALQIDPDYAPAHATLASGLSYKAMFSPNGDVARWRSIARDHARRAVALAPYDVDVRYALATYHRQSGERSDAIASLDRVLALQPDHPVATFDLPFVHGLCTASAGESLDRLREMLAGLSPDNPVRWVVLSHIADLKLAQGDYRGAEGAARQSRQIVKSTWSGFTLAVSLAGEGRDSEALAVSDETKLEWPDLDYRAFAATSLADWCIGGPDRAAVERGVLALAAAESVRSAPNEQN